MKETCTSEIFSDTEQKPSLSAFYHSEDPYQTWKHAKHRQSIVPQLLKPRRSSEDLDPVALTWSCLPTCIIWTKIQFNHSLSTMQARNHISVSKCPTIPATQATKQLQFFFWKWRTTAKRNGPKVQAVGQNPAWLETTKWSKGKVVETVRIIAVELFSCIKYFHFKRKSQGNVGNMQTHLYF